MNGMPCANRTIRVRQNLTAYAFAARHAFACLAVFIPEGMVVVAFDVVDRFKRRIVSAFENRCAHDLLGIMQKAEVACRISRRR